MATVNPRHAAFLILNRIAKERSYADILLDQELSHGAIKGLDRGLLTELVYGVLRRQGTLDHVISLFSSVKIDRIERSVLILLRLGLYQLLFLDRVPVSAAVNETVKLAKILAPKAPGFVNAVLREADRKRDAITWPDKAKNQAEWMAARHSVPQWIAKAWLGQLGPEEAELLAEAMSEAPPLTIRANTLKNSREQLIETLAAEEVPARPCRFSPLGIQISSRTPLTVLNSYQQGLFTIQDEASQLAALILDPAPGDRVLDVCAAPGGKATGIAELMGNTGEVVACDSNPRRLAQVQQLAKRLGTGIVGAALMDAEKPLASSLANSFSKVLVDAPCSGLGVLRRNPEGKWWKSPDDIEALAQRQRLILANASSAVAPGGVLVYATCSTTIRENECIVDDFLSRHNNFVLEDIRVFRPQYAILCSNQGYFRPWPHQHGMDGFFAARLRRQEKL
ncbi:16S rRNA (cytosine(967)-C(5))-methyltransferase RsmB [Geobacter pelophilus]|uniref:16S rRNA (cytosine(967)-C(5))-methyltransferase n=1 Tax=Geoanaerobacter pelophilus TaxID=60036 RepID=A0AAW4L6P8_9BACT|nr:16S rRNA (cytosine(967)-C(5))-methyltransferase RsmB [Geoanaerobacter pelophilus]MBT0665180.1 16S rRNA (cytosine(967)-C(5))-methyltransferase RsmB [Geoanaerobacter pelophilus]